MEDILSLCQRSPGGAVTRRLPNCFSTVQADVTGRCFTFLNFCYEICETEQQKSARSLVLGVELIF